MLGEDTDIENEPGTFNSASVWGRISVVAAGPVFNFIMAFVLSVIIVGAVGYEPSRVLSVKEGSAAEAAGLKEGDIITGYQGYHIDLGKDLYVYSYLNQLKEGDTINLTVKRDGKKMDISYKSDTNVRYLLGCNFNGDDTSAMTVESVMDGMPLQEAGIQQGDVITSINGVKITNAADYQKKRTFIVMEHIVQHRLSTTLGFALRVCGFMGKEPPFMRVDRSHRRPASGIRRSPDRWHWT